MTEHKKTEEALRESEEQLRKAVEGAPIPTIMQAEDGQVLQISHSWTDLTGYTINHVRSFDEWITKAVYGEGANRVRDHLHELFSGDKHSIGVEFTLRTLKGDSRYWSFSASSPGALRDGRRFIVGMAVDITERRQMQEKLEEYAKNLEGLVEERTKKLETSALYARGLLEASLDPLVTINAEGKITDVNKATETATGCSREELVGSDFSDYFTQPDEARKGYLQVFQNGFVRDYSLSIRSKSGNIVEVLYNATLFRNEAGEVEGVFAAARDMTEHNKAEEALLNERKRLFDVLETLPAMVCILTPDHHVDFANRSFRDRFGNSEGRYCYDYCFGNKEPCIFCESYKPLETGKPHHWEVNAPDGSVIDAYDFPFTDVDGSTKILEMDIDITERRRMEKQLKDSERLTAIGTTAGMVGHDIRNPLQAIASDVYLAKSDLSSMPDGEAKEGLKESLDGIDKNIEYINKIVQDLQDFARPIKPNAQETSLEGLCEDVLLSNMVPENIDASCHVEKKVKKIVTDPAVLKRVLSNLVNNAFQAMPEGGKIYVRAYQEAGDTVITVQDTGGGIPEDVKSKLFTPLFTTKSKGQGFGLAVIKRMTEALGGTVSYESKVGEGTKFFIRLPSPKELNGKWVFK